MSERPTRIKPPTAKLTDANNAEPFALSSHRDSVAAYARARAQATQSTPSVDTSSSAVNNVGPISAPVNQVQPPPSVPASPDIEPVSNKRPLRATVTDEEEDNTEVLSDTAPAKSKKQRRKRARNEAGAFFLTCFKYFPLISNLSRCYR
jgi:hypothetical protein